MGILSRIFTRRIDAASGLKQRDLGWFGQINSEVGAASGTVRSRARHAAVNDPHIANAVANWVSALLGPDGPRPTHDDSDALERWNAWSRGRNFPAVLAGMVRAERVDGEAIALLSGDRVRHLPIEHLSDETRPVDGGREIVSGVEVDLETGDALAYWLHPNLSEMGGYSAPVRYDADNVLHLFSPVAAGQRRGLSPLAPSLLSADALAGTLDGLGMRAKLAAQLFGSVTRDPMLEPNGPSTLTQIGEERLKPASFMDLQPGEKLELFAASPGVENGTLLAVKVREIAAGLGLPSYLVDGDLTGANYSSLRAGLLPFKARVEAYQYQLLTPILDRIWSRVTLADPPEWLFAPLPSVDPWKQTQADLAELKAGLTSRKQLVAQRGWDLEQLDSELAAEGWPPRNMESPE